jgi:hypothetical protein
MAVWTTPNTATAGNSITAANHNTYIRDNLKALLPLDALAWTSYTPTVTQSGTVSNTQTYAKYTRLGNLIVVRALLSMTSTGTGNNLIVVSLPVTATAGSDIPCGEGYIKAGGTWFPGLAITNTTSTIAFIDTTQTTGGLGLGQTGTAANGALVSGNTIGYRVAYEA